MNIIKLNATDSTNDYLKRLLKSQYTENFLIVWALDQHAGKGQMGAKWNSEKAKNLTFSILVKDLIVNLNDIFLLNVATSLAISRVLNGAQLTKVSVKWPNDIMSGNYKIGGILIENILKNNHDVYSVIGIGLNVNQLVFEGLPHATSMQKITQQIYDLESVLWQIVNELKGFLIKINQKKHEELWQLYHDVLYRKGLPTPFEDSSGFRFMGIIKHVDNSGKLHVMLEDDTEKNFEVKELKLLL